jgi:predicted component of type VI protein secretion system
MASSFTVPFRDGDRIELRERDDGVLLGRIEDPLMLAYDFVVAVTWDDPHDDARRASFPRRLRLGSWTTFAVVLTSASRGIRVEHVQGLAAFAAAPPELLTFRLRKEGEDWSSVVETGSFAFYVTSDRPKTLELYALRPPR